MQNLYASICGSVELNGDSADCRYGFAHEYDIDLLSIIFELVEEGIDIFEVCEPDHDFKFLQLHIERVLEVAEEDAHLFVNDVRTLLDDQVYIPDRDVLDLWLAIHQRNKRRSHLAAYGSNFFCFTHEV